MTDPLHDLDKELEGIPESVDLDILKGHMNRAAQAAGHYYTQLTNSGVPKKLAETLVSQWHPAYWQDDDIEFIPDEEDEDD